MNILIKPFLMNTLLRFSLLICLGFLLQASSCNNSIKELEYKGIQRTSLESLQFNKTALRIELGYYNPNNFGVDVKETNLAIYLNDKFIAQAEQPEKTQIPKLAQFSFPVVAYFDPLKVLGTAFSSLFSKKNTVRIQGTAKLGKNGVYIKVPVNISEQVSLYSK